MSVNPRPLVLLGFGGHGKSCLAVLRYVSHYSVLGYLDPTAVTSDRLAYLGSDSALPSLVDAHPNLAALVTVGHLRSSKIRRSLFRNCVDMNIACEPIVALTAIVDDSCSIGLGSIVMNNAFVNCQVTIGCNTIVNSCSIVEHGASLGCHSHVSTGVIVNGDVRIGDGVFVGSGSIIREGVTIGDEAFISAGSKVFSDVCKGEIVRP